MTKRSSKDLTWREKKVFRFVRDYIAGHGYAPSIREIGEAAGLASTSSVAYVLSRLQIKGYLTRTAGRQALAVAGMVLVERKDLYNLVAAVDGWIDMDGDEGYERLRGAAGLT